MEDLRQTIEEYYQEKGLDTQNMDGVEYGYLLCLGLGLVQLHHQFEQQEE